MNAIMIPTTINKIPKNDIRYEILKTIPEKEYSPADNYNSASSFVYLRINDEKDYYMVSVDASIQLQLIWYPPRHLNRVVRLWANRYIIPRPYQERQRKTYLPSHYESDMHYRKHGYFEDEYDAPEFPEGEQEEYDEVEISKLCEYYLQQFDNECSQPSNDEYYGDY